MDSSSNPRSLPNPVVTTWRYLSGLDNTGSLPSDATWTRPGINGIAAKRLTWWSARPRRTRALVRTVGTATGPFLAYGALTQPHITVGAVQSALLASALPAGNWAGKQVTVYRHKRDWLKPLHLALVPHLGHDVNARYMNYLHIPSDFGSAEHVGTIDLPAHLTNTAELGSIVKAKLGLHDAQVSTYLTGRYPHLRITIPARPPKRVTLETPAFASAIKRTKDGNYILGLGPRDSAVSVDLDSDAPHILVSASTGGGKSVLVRTITAQAMGYGARAVCLDFKMHSHRWLNDSRLSERVEYSRSMQEIHDSLVSLGEEGMRRNRVVLEYDGPEGDAPVGDRVIVILEELNATLQKLARWWTKTRGKNDPKMSPAIEALGEILYMGRAVKMNVIAVGQSATAAALGGPAVRECFSARILSRHTVNSWKMLVPEVPYQRPSSVRGRVHYVYAGTATETQVAFLEDSEAVQLAAAGDTLRRVSLIKRRVPTQPVTGENAPGDTATGTSSESLKNPLTLREACDTGVVTVGYETARKMRQRVGDLPASAQIRGVDAFTREELIVWSMSHWPTKAKADQSK